jgi:hypothetical protein
MRPISILIAIETHKLEKLIRANYNNVISSEQNAVLLFGRLNLFEQANRWEIKTSRFRVIEVTWL